MLKSIRTTELEFDAGCWQQRPPAIKTLQHRLHRPEAKGHACGHSSAAAESEQTPDRQTEPLTAPIEQSQINGTPCRGRKRRELVIDPLRLHRIQRIQLR